MENAAVALVAPHLDWLANGSVASSYSRRNGCDIAHQV